MQFQLMFNDQEIATVTQLEADFPNMSGRFALVEGIHKRSDLKHVMEFVAYTIRVSTLDPEAELSGADLQEEEQFVDLIQSDSWYLADAAGNRHPILVPNLCSDGILMWRWRVT